MKHDAFKATVKALTAYAEIEGTEIGEACSLLISLCGYKNYVSETFEEALRQEVIFQLNFLKERTKIVETEETYTRKCVNLEWL